MVNLVIFGTGKSCEKILESIKVEKVNIVCFIDNDPKKINQYYKNSETLIRSTKDILNLKYDYILIASIYPEVMCEQLDKMGIEPMKIIKYYTMGKNEIIKYQDFLHRELVLYDLLDVRMDKEIKRLEGSLQNIPYEMYDRLHKNKIKLPMVISMQKTIEDLLKRNCSLSRIGDGEFMLMVGRSINFQSFDKKLAQRLEEVLQSKSEACMIAISDEFGELDYFIKSRSRDDTRMLMASGLRETMYSKLDFNKVYGNAFITRPYMFLNTRDDAEYYFDAFKTLWDKKEVLIIEGERTYFGIGNDLIENANACERIIAPSTNAFSCYENIYHKAMEWLTNKKPENCIVLAALGPTASILAYDISRMGYQIIDIGHLDLEYEWYRRKVEEAIVIRHKYCDNIIGGSNPQQLTNNTYDKQVIASIT